VILDLQHYIYRLPWVDVSKALLLQENTPEVSS